jgi:hypothetical protein
MADVKISGLPASTTPLDGTEVLPIVQGTTTKQVSVTNLTSGRAVSALSLTSTNDASINSLTVGKGAGNVASNTVCGNAALGSNVTGSQNVAVGQQALRVSTASNNTAIGAGALYSNSTGGQNTVVGRSAGQSITTGTYNTVLGYNAAYAGTALVDGSYNTYIGYNAQASSASPANELVISGTGGVGKGTSTGFIAQSSGVYQGNNSAAWSITSDQRLKKNIVSNTTGLSAITAIQVRNFEYRAAEEVTELQPTCAIDIQGIQLGAIAQELQTILPECVKTESTGVMSIDTTNLTWYLINAVKELSAKFDAYVASHP